VRSAGVWLVIPCSPTVNVLVVTETDHDDEVDALLTEQMAYYRARAPEYDDWWYRVGDHDLGPLFASSWRGNTNELLGALDRFAPTGEVLELAAGTGVFTEAILRHAERVTVVDASSEVLALNAARNGTGRVEQVVADLFSWEPPARWDTIVFGFWISHIPARRWVTFWSMVARALAPGGRVWFCDNADDQYVVRHGPPEVRGAFDDNAMPATGEVKRRVLHDGSSFTIVKRYWTPAQLEAELAGLGWRARCTNTEWAFIHGTAHRA
jgi:SAM-dependent methyltransferase